MSALQDFPCKASILVDKNINFLFGSGASAGYIPTLWLYEEYTYETILTDKNFDGLKDYIYLDYYKKIIKKAFCHDPSEATKKTFNSTFNDYTNFIRELIGLLDKKSVNHIRRANIFTTNYDLFFENASDSLQNELKFKLNDGSLGLINKTLDVSNFHLSSWHQGTHDLYRYEIPTVNLIKMHGSVSWIKKNEHIIGIEYPNKDNCIVEPNLQEKTDLEKLVMNYELLGSDMSEYVIFTDEEKEQLNNFISQYEKLAIVNPTKEKFEETVFQQHYYQSLRLLSYELEKPQTVLICFGFSFQDEHIKEIIKRSLSNPSLKVFVFCYKKDEKDKIKSAINDPRITFIYPKDPDYKIGYAQFIKRVFTSDKGDSLEWTSL